MLTASVCWHTGYCITRALPCGTVTAWLLQATWRAHASAVELGGSHVGSSWSSRRAWWAPSSRSPSHSFKYIACRNMAALVALCSTSSINFVIESQPASWARQIAFVLLIVTLSSRCSTKQQYSPVSLRILVSVLTPENQWNSAYEVCLKHDFDS